MSDRLITYAFVSGEVSPQLLGRTDLEKYDFGLATCLNFFVDYRGGISTRPGTAFVDYVEHDDLATRFVPFKFAPNLANTYLILFGDEYIRFVQDSAYVLEAEVAISGVTKADPGVVTTSSAHGLSPGDWVKIFDVEGMIELNAQGTFKVGAVPTSTSFELEHPLSGTIDTTAFTTYTSGGSVARIYTVTSPYGAEDLEDLKHHQIRDTVRLTHPDHPVKNLVRLGATNWTISNEVFGSELDTPSKPNVTASSAGNAEVLFAVTAVVGGDESLPSDIQLLNSAVDYSSSAGFASLSWTGVVDAEFYNVYRSRIVNGANSITLSEQLGFIGQALGPSFVDNNIVPDFTVAPPQNKKPFADGAIEYIEVTAGGTGYTRGASVSISDPTGTGFRGFPIVSNAGAVIAIAIIDGGSGYTNPVVSVTGGTGAAFSTTVSALTGNNPAVSAVFQQRQLYAATGNEPLGIWGSRPGQLSNMDVSRVLTDGDSYEFELDSDIVAPIRHLVPSRNGLLVWTQSGVWLLSGGNERAVTPINGLAEPQTSTGAAKVPPISMDTDILYLEDKGRAVRLLGFNELTKAFAGRDMSILANHLFSHDNQITHWSFAQAPYNIIWARREDGVLLSFTLEQEQNVFAWARHTTKGIVEDVMAVEEGSEEAVYLMVTRLIEIGGVPRWTKFIERMASREFDHVEDAWAVDCGLRTSHVTPASVLRPGAATGNNILFTADSGVFAAGDVGKIIRVGGGKAEIITFVDTSNVRVNILRNITKILPEDENNTPLPAEVGDWSMDAPFSSVGGLNHLEGQTVKILLDGNVIPDQVVEGGSVSFAGAEGTRAVVGLGFRAVAKTLPPVSTQVALESLRKNVKGSAVRVYDTRGLKVGDSLSHLYEMKDRTVEDYGEPILLQDGFKYVLLRAEWDEDGQTFYVQDYPLPATVLGLVLDMEIGDDSG